LIHSNLKEYIAIFVNYFLSSQFFLLHKEDFNFWEKRKGYFWNIIFHLELLWQIRGSSIWLTFAHFLWFGIQINSLTRIPNIMIDLTLWIEFNSQGSKQLVYKSSHTPASRNTLCMQKFGPRMLLQQHYQYCVCVCVWDGRERRGKGTVTFYWSWIRIMTQLHFMERKRWREGTCCWLCTAVESQIMVQAHTRERKRWRNTYANRLQLKS
jgi:hypothetical protein